MISKDLINELEAALNNSMQLLTSFNPVSLNTVPFAGSWTGAQVGQHMLLSEKGMDKLLLAPTKTADRAPDANAENFRNIFLDFNKKFDAPDFIVPENKVYDGEALVEALETEKEKMLQAIQVTDTAQLASLPDGHPLAGSTKLEIIYFLLYHTQRHNHQLQNIKNKLQG